jgi:predicted aldo/keto reductase-like oxidoreductase
LRNVWITQNLQLRPRKLLPQRRQHRQRQDKITEGASANDQNFLHFLCLPDRWADDTIGPPMNTNRFSRRSFLKRSAAGSLLLAQGGLLCGSAPVKRTAVDQVTLGNTGVRLSRVGMGTGSDNGHIQRALGKEGFNSLVHYAYDQGITYLDCAQAYATFDWIGDAIKGLPREKLFIQSKINHQPDDILKEIDLHRKVFDTDYVDSLLVHCMIKKDWPDTWKRVREGYDQAQEKKWIRAKGVSCHSLPALRDAAASEWPEVHLVRVNPQGAFMDGPEQNYNMVPNETGPVMEQLKIMRAKGRGVIGMKMIGNGTFVNAEDRQKAVRLAMSMPEINAVVIGFKSRAEIDEGLSRVNAALAELAG